MNELTVSQILEAASSVSGVSVQALLSNRRSRRYARPRQIVMFLSRELTTKSLPAIARSLGRDHTTVLHGARIIPELALRDGKLRAMIEQIRLVVAL
jgi:chromosomal replication initiator protein